MSVNHQVLILNQETASLPGGSRPGAVIMARLPGTPSCTFLIQIRSGDGKMHIDGVGFVWNTLTNAGSMVGLVISNQVHTILNKDLVKDTNTVYTIPRTNNPASSNDVLHVYSDHFTFDRELNLLTYPGVQPPIILRYAADSVPIIQMSLSSDTEGQIVWTFLFEAQTTRLP